MRKAIYQWELVRSVFKGALPANEPEGVTVVTREFKRGAVVPLADGSAYIVITGRVLDEATTEEGGIVYLFEHVPGAVLLVRHGDTWSCRTASRLVEITGQWQELLPGIEAAHRAGEHRRMAELVNRAVMMADTTVAERVKWHLAHGPQESSVTHLARWIGASRESCSKVLCAMGISARPAKDLPGPSAPPSRVVSTPGGGSKVQGRAA